MKFIGKRTKYKENVSQDNFKYVMMFFLVSLFLFPAVLMMVASIQASHQGSQISDLDHEIRALNQEIRQIQSEVVSKTSLSEVSESAEEMGFVAPEQLVYIQKDSPVAQLQ